MDEQIDFFLNDEIEKERDDGNIEYKRELLNLDEEIINNRMTQMKYRIYEGNGEALYFLGVGDDGKLLGLTKDEYELSIQNLELIAKNIDCYVIKIYESSKNENYIGEFLIRENNKEYVQIKIAVAGNVDSGKSTTIGVLVKGILDDGRGKARTSVFNYKHEIDSGRTSSIGHQNMMFNREGNIINSKVGEKNEISKNINFYDLAGHEKYLRTTIYGLTSLYPDYCLIMVGANMGINQMTREHIGLCINLKIPFIIIVTKIDIVPSNVLEETMTKINNICKNRIKKIPYNIKNISDIVNVIKNIKSDSIVPVIQISNTTNYNLVLLKSLFHLLPVRNDYNQYINENVEFLIDNTYSVTGHSTIVSGMIKSGTIKVNDTLLIGPFYDSSYKTIKVRSIHVNYKNINEAKAGNYVCISLKNVLRREIKKGMILITDDNSMKLAVTQFKAQIHILHSPTTIRIGYTPFLHIDHVRQAAKIIGIEKVSEKVEKDDDKILRSGDKANVILEFLIKPEYIIKGMRLIFREGKVKEVGKVID
jgi:GTPase